MGGRAGRGYANPNDERLIRWLRRTGPDVVIMDFNVMPKRAVRFGGNQIFVRNLDPATHEFTLADRDLELKPLVDELERIRAIAERWVTQNVR